MKHSIAFVFMGLIAPTVTMAHGQPKFNTFKAAPAKLELALRSAKLFSLALIRETGYVRIDFAGTRVLPKEHFRNLVPQISERPTIFIQETSGREHQLDLGKTFQGYRWVGAAALNEKKIWAFLDWTTDGPSHELLVVESSSAAESWRFAQTIKKPHYLCLYRDIAMRLDGKGQISFECATAGAMPDGVYSLTTSDFGRTWSTGPTFTPNDLQAATTPLIGCLVPNEGQNVDDIERCGIRLSGATKPRR